MKDVIYAFSATNVLNFQLPIQNLLSDGHSTDETVFYIIFLNLFYINF